MAMLQTATDFGLDHVEHALGAVVAAPDDRELGIVLSHDEPFARGEGVSLYGFSSNSPE